MAEKTLAREPHDASASAGQRSKPARRRRARQLRDVEGFDAAAAEVMRRCAPEPFKRLIVQVGAWIPSPSLEFVTPALLYNMAIGLKRNGWNLYQDERARKERGAVVIPIERARDRTSTVPGLREWCADMGTAKWMPPWDLDGMGVDGKPSYAGPGERFGYEPTLAEWRAGLFGMDEGSGP